MRAVPVVFFIFNRPEETGRVWSAIRAARAKRVYVFSDAPRPDIKDEVDRVVACRAITETVDWPCHVVTDYATTHMGCRHRIVSGLDHVFTEEDKAIILEDDTLPVASFFEYCRKILERYADDDEVFHINGRNNLISWDAESSYFFARRTNPWGWATWRRAWRSFDPDIARLSPEESDGLARTLGDPEHAEFVELTADRFADRTIDTWDIQWMLTVLKHGGLSVVPRVNLVRNLGFRDTATHTNNTENDMRASFPVFNMDKTIRHPCSQGYGAEGRRFDRFYFLFELLNTYGEPGVLMALSRLLNKSRDSAAETPVAALVEPFLAPARYPAETRELLHHLDRYIPGNPTLRNLLGYFA